MSITGKMTSNDHKARVATGSKMRLNSHTATARSPIPKMILVTFIQGHALGINLPADVPMIISGIPMPMPKEKSAIPPK
jgi:hypothetical protein